MIDWIEQHREILGWLAGGVATAAGGAWVVVRYLLDRSRDGIASAGGMQIVGNISIEHNRIPRGALGHSREIAAITVEKSAHVRAGDRRASAFRKSRKRSQDNVLRATRLPASVRHMLLFSSTISHP